MTIAAIENRIAALSPMKRLGAAIVSGMVMGLGQAPFHLLPVAMVGLVAAIYLFSLTDTTRAAAKTGWAIGVGYFLATMFWIMEPFFVDAAATGWMAPFAWVLLAGGLALFWGLGFGVARAAMSGHRAIFGLALSWTLAEALRGYVLTGFPWGLLAYQWVGWGGDQVAAFVGPYGLSALTILICASVVAFGKKTTVAVGMGVIAVIYVGWSAKAPEATDHVVRMVQPNAAQHEKWDPDKTGMFFARSKSLSAQPADPILGAADVVIWPETSVPFLLEHSEIAFEQIARASGAPTVIGIQRRGDRGHRNSMAVVNADGTTGWVYDKHHLVPFGEYIPGGRLAERLGLTGLAQVMTGGYEAGTGADVFDLGALGTVLPLICYELIFTQDVAAMPSRPDWILQITNDAWFGDIAGPHQHLAQARMRAIENGLPVVRVANTGISAVIDSRGRIVDQIPMGVADYRDVRLPAARPLTLYARLGDWIIFIMLFTAFGALTIFSRKYD